MNPHDETLHELVARLMARPVNEAAAPLAWDPVVSLDASSSPPIDEPPGRWPPAVPARSGDAAPGDTPHFALDSLANRDEANAPARVSSMAAETTLPPAPRMSPAEEGGGRFGGEAPFLPSPVSLESLAGAETAASQAWPRNLDPPLADRSPPLEPGPPDSEKALSAARPSDGDSRVVRACVTGESGPSRGARPIDHFADIARAADHPAATDAGRRWARPPLHEPRIAELFEQSRTAAETLARLAERLEQLEAAHFARGRL